MDLWKKTKTKKPLKAANDTRPKKGKDNLPTYLLSFAA